MREIGLGCSKDLADAIKMHERAAARGHGQACYRLGGFYDDGVGVERDPEQALRWYERGRELGDPNATGCCASEATRHFCAVARAETRKRLASRPVWKSKFYGAFVLNRRVVLHAIDATPARWRGVLTPTTRHRAEVPRGFGGAAPRCVRIAQLAPPLVPP